MIVVLYWITLWTYGGLWLTRIWKRRLTTADISLAFPLGAGISGLTALLAWMFRVDFQRIATLIEISLVLAMVHVLLRLPPAVFRIHFARIRMGIVRLATKELPWTEVILWTLVGFSLAVMAVWQLMVEPVTWDSITLYDFRALRLAEGWLPTDFFRQFANNPAFFGYDFLHPFLPSVLGAFVYKSGGSHTPIINLTLLICVLFEAWKFFRSIQSKLVFAVLFLASPLFINAAVEGYGAWTAVLFWLLFFFLFLQLPKRPKVSQIIAGLFLAAATQSRLSEPYWIVIGILLTWKRKLAILLPTVAAFFGWRLLVQQSSQFGVRGDASAVFDFTRWSQLSEVFIVFLAKNPAVPYLAAMLVATYFLWRRRALDDGLLEFLLVLIGWGALILTGLFYFFFQGGTIWNEVQLSLARAVLPLAAGCAVFTATAVDRLQSRESLVH